MAREKRIKEKSINFVYLNKEKEEIEQALESKKIKSEKQIRILKFMLENEEALVSDIEMFADGSRAIVNTLCKNGYLKMMDKKVERDPFEFKDIKKTEKLVLTPEQKQAFDTIKNSMEDMLFSEFLIFGVTGSRKNRNIFAIN